MTPITSPSRILVTGANGYVATWVVKVILDKGHTVIGTVRSPSKGEYLRKLFGDKFSYTLVPDIGEV
jgi:nucleoside-diphosphate-sugar epimerase